jgi:hypothetical protein
VRLKGLITEIVGRIPYRLALAGGWIDQPFVSRHNPTPPGSMVVVNVEPTFRFMDRSGICGSTREVARRIWNDQLPNRKPADLVRELYAAENRGKKNPSGSQDMIGLIYPGISRLGYDFAVHGGVFPAHVETLNNHRIARWLQNVLHILPIAPRPDGYTPLGKKNLEPKWISRLGRTGADCFDAIRRMDAVALGKSFNECMECWKAILPGTVRHHTLKIDLVGLLKLYQENHPGAMYSGCGGGYLLVVSEKSVPGSFQVKIRLAPK